MLRAPRAPRVIHVHNRAEIAWLAKAAGLGPAVLSCDYHFEPWRRFAHLREASKAMWRRCLMACDRIAPVSDYCLGRLPRVLESARQQIGADS